MRVALFLSEYPSASGPGGLCTYTLTLARALADTGHSVALLHREGFSPPLLPTAIRPCLVKPKLPKGLKQALFRRLLPEIAYERAVSFGLRRALERLRVEDGIEVAQVPEYNGDAALLDRLPCRLVVRLHTPAFLLDRLNGVRASWRRKRWYAFEGLGIAHADAVTCSSRALAKSVSVFYGIPAKKVVLIRNAVDIETFKPASTPSSGPVRILFAGRFERRKGMHLLLAAVPVWLSRHSDVRITVAGSASGGSDRLYESALTELVNRHPGKVEWLGPVGKPAMPALYQSADIFVIPSLFDNSPNSLFEAQATGLACVGGRVGGIDEMITHGDNGLLFDTRSHEGLLENVSELVRDGALRQRLGKNARQRIEAFHAPGIIARETAAHYESLLNKY